MSSELNIMKSPGFSGITQYASSYTGTYEDVRQAIINVAPTASPYPDNLSPPYPDNLLQCTNLESLSYIGDPFSNSLSFLVNLSTLILNFNTSNNSPFLPEGLNEMSSLTHLEISNANFLNKSQEYKLSLVNLKALQFLSLYSCKLDTLPTGTENLSTLQELDVSANNFKKFTISKYWTNLRSLDITNNTIKNLSYEPEKLTTLESLYTAGNHSLVINELILNKFPFLTNFSSSQDDPLVLPSSITHLTLDDARSLNMLNNSAHINTHLQHLELLNTAASDYPTPLKHLTALESLKINDNFNLRELPEYFQNFKHLKNIDLGRLNSIDTDVIHELSDLEVLVAWNLTNPLNLDRMPLLTDVEVNHVSITNTHTALTRLYLHHRIDSNTLQNTTEVDEIDRMIGLLPQLSRFTAKIITQGTITLINTAQSVNLVFIRLEITIGFLSFIAQLDNSTINNLASNNKRVVCLIELAKGSSGSLRW